MINRSETLTPPQGWTCGIVSRRAAQSMRTETPLPAQIPRNTFRRFSIALLAIVVALVARWVLNPFLGTSLPYLTLFPAIAFAAWHSGVIPAVLAVVVALLGAHSWFVVPTHTLRVVNDGDLVGMVVFLLVSAIIVALGEASRRKIEAVHNARGELEERVKQRTVELDGANQNLRHLSARLLQLQDEERRRIARELHDSVGQMLAALTMNLSTARADVERLAKTSVVLAESEDLVQEMSREVRTISHLLHPPLLDEAGLDSAIRWYIDGFAQRSNIKIGLDLPMDFGRLPRDLETAIFRTVQECLTNIHRHSESPTADVRITRFDGNVRVEVEDKGRGIPPGKLDQLAVAGTPGVGIRGMRERIQQLGGTLEIDSKGEGKGTVIKAHLPVAGTSSTAAA